jgi:general secretion pathway protein H
MLALVILGAASALVAVNMPPPEPTLAREARVLAARLQAAGEEAVVSGTPVGVDLDAAGYRFRRRMARDWRPIADDPMLAPRTWPAGVRVEIIRDGARLDRSRLEGLESSDFAGFEADALPPPALRFDAVGAATELALDLRDGSRAFRITVAANGEIALAALGPGERSGR